MEVLVYNCGSGTFFHATPERVLREVLGKTTNRIRITVNVAPLKIQVYSVKR